MSRPVHIYALSDPDTGALRYIGQTAYRPEVRLSQHWSRALFARDRSPRADWLRQLRARGKRPLLTVLETVAPADAAQAEARHIAAHLQSGCDLVNRPFIPHAPGDVFVGVSLPPATHQALTDLAGVRRGSVAHLIRHIVEEWLASEDRVAG